MAISKQRQFILAFLALTTLALSNRDQVVAFDPLVETGVSAISPDGKHVGVNLPGIFNLVLDTRGNSKGVKMTESVLAGLVKVNLDRVRGDDGKLKGPIKVSVGGITVYDNQEPPLST